jgi:Methyltransferase domain
MLRTSKAMVRHLIAILGLSRLYLLFRQYSGNNVQHLYLNSLQDRFSAVYKNRVWLNGRATGSLSGLGSELENTTRVRQALPGVLAELGTRTLLDLGCGDFGWMKEVKIPCKYIGVDIVPDLIAENAARFGSATRSFQVLDATSAPLPEADTVLCRDVLFHLSFKDIWRVIDNLHDSGISYLIATSDNGMKLNADALSGDYRCLNLCKTPFHFPTPKSAIADNEFAANRILAAWQVSSLPRHR